MKRKKWFFLLHFAHLYVPLQQSFRMIENKYIIILTPPLPLPYMGGDLLLPDPQALGGELLSPGSHGTPLSSRGKATGRRVSGNGAGVGFVTLVI